MASAKTLINRLKGDPSVLAAVVNVAQPDGKHALAVVSDGPGPMVSAMIAMGTAVAAWADAHPGELPREIVEPSRALGDFETNARQSMGQAPIRREVPETPDRKTARQHSEELTREIHEIIAAQLPHGCSSLFMIANDGPAGDPSNWMTYAASIARGDAVRMLRELAAKLEAETLQ